MQLKKFSFNNFIIFYLWVYFNGMNMRRTNVVACVNKNIKKIVGKRCVFVYMHDPFSLKLDKKLKIYRNYNSLKVK